MEEKKMNSQQIEGRNAVMEAFRSGKPIDKVYILDDQKYRKRSKKA